MRKPEKKFFKSSFGPQSIMELRTWIYCGAKVADLVRWIKGEYSRAKKWEDQIHLGCMLTAAMSASETFNGRLLARRCAELFNIPVGKGQSPGEAAYLMLSSLKQNEEKVLPESFNPYFVRKCPTPREAAPQRIVSDGIGLKDHHHLITVNERLRVYFMRDELGNAWLIALNSCNKDMLVDEEDFNDEPPLYFTESDHFLSPVWIVKQVARILEYILRKIGYPPLNIYKRVIFDAPNATLVNEDDYIVRMEWQGVDVMTLRKINRSEQAVFPAPAVPVAEVSDEWHFSKQDLNTKLYLSVMGTAEVLKFFNITKYQTITGKMIEEFCKDVCIFPPDDWDEVLGREIRDFEL